MEYFNAFLFGGLLCALGQILIDRTKLTPAKILVCYVTAGVILGGLGVYQYLVDWAGAGATVPLTGFGYTLAKGAREAVQQHGLLGAFIGGAAATAGGVAAAIFFGFRPLCSSNPDQSDKKQVEYSKLHLFFLLMRLPASLRPRPSAPPSGPSPPPAEPAYPSSTEYMFAEILLPD